MSRLHWLREGTRKTRRRRELPSSRDQHRLLQQDEPEHTAESRVIIASVHRSRSILRPFPTNLILSSTRAPSAGVLPERSFHDDDDVDPWVYRCGIAVLQNGCLAKFKFDGKSGDDDVYVAGSDGRNLLVFGGLYRILGHETRELSIERFPIPIQGGEVNKIASFWPEPWLALGVSSATSAKVCVVKYGLDEESNRMLVSPPLLRIDLAARCAAQLQNIVALPNNSGSFVTQDLRCLRLWDVEKQQRVWSTRVHRLPTSQFLRSRSLDAISSMTTPGHSRFGSKAIIASGPHGRQRIQVFDCGRTDGPVMTLPTKNTEEVSALCGRYDDCGLLLASSNENALIGYDARKPEILWRLAVRHELRLDRRPIGWADGGGLAGDVLEPWGKSSVWIIASGRAGWVRVVPGRPRFLARFSLYGASTSIPLLGYQKFDSGRHDSD